MPTLMTYIHVHYLPISAPLFFLFLAVVIAMVALAAFRILQFAYEQIGINEKYVFGILLLSLLGSYINIPVAQFPGTQVISDREFALFGLPYVVPQVVDWPGTIIAVNVGGAVIPVLLSLYLMIKNSLYLKSILAITGVAIVCHMLAQPVAGAGIALPIFVPMTATAIIALLLSREHAGPLAYIGGSLGTLLGADLLNLDKIQSLGAPIASIGGAGTFDGIFVTGILAVLLASLVDSRK